MAGAQNDFIRDSLLGRSIRLALRDPFALAQDRNRIEPQARLDGPVRLLRILERHPFHTYSVVAPLRRIGQPLWASCPNQSAAHEKC
jgi:hypothetical protein